MAKQTIYNAGIYVRLSQEDMRAGESLSIENQKLILTKYVKEQGWNLVDTYVDDGWSGTDFDRPAVQRLLSDAQSGKINLIICKDLSRFGRNYIEVGRYVDYIFPSYNIRFIALNDNVDTASKDTSALDMMPIVNLFNEWHAASTSKKIKAVIEANAKAGKYRTTCAPFGYTKGDDPNHLPVIDPDAAPIVRNIFEMRASGISPHHIADKLNEDGVPISSDYYYAKLGKPNPRRTRHMWSPETVRQILHNYTYYENIVVYRPIIKKIAYWIKYEENKPKTDYETDAENHDKYRAAHDLDCVLRDGDLRADTIFSLWLPLRLALVRVSGYDKIKEVTGLDLNQSIPFLKTLIQNENLQKLLPIKNETTWLLSELFYWGQQVENTMILPERGLQSRGCKPYYDYMPYFLRDCFENGKFHKAFGSDEKVCEWVKRENLECFFSGTICKENIVDLAGNGDVKNGVPDDLNYMLKSYILILQKRAR